MSYYFDYFITCESDISLTAIYIAEGQWKLVVRTSDFIGAGTSARVFVTFYGLKSHSEKLRLTTDDSDPFQHGTESTFTVFFVNRRFDFCYISTSKLTLFKAPSF